MFIGILLTFVIYAFAFWVPNNASPFRLLRAAVAAEVIIALGVYQMTLLEKSPSDTIISSAVGAAWGGVLLFIAYVAIAIYERRRLRRRLREASETLTAMNELKRKHTGG